MASEEKGEWKLVKVWECKGCKLLIKDGVQVFDHMCTVKDKDNELFALRKTIEHKNLALEERDRFIDTQKNKIHGLNDFVKILDDNIERNNKSIEEKDKVIEEQRIIVDSQKKDIINKDATIENQKRNQNKVIEKIVYLEKDTPNTGNNQSVEHINVDIWKKDYRIKDSKNGGYREEIEIEIFERGKGREKIIIKNGKVIKKPDDIIIIGERTSDGFITKGIYRN